MAKKGPVLIALETQEVPPVSDAPAVPDIDIPRGQVMQQVANLVTRKPSRLLRWFWSLLAALIGAMISLAAWDYVNALLERNLWLGWGVTGLFGAVVLLLVVLVLREVAAFGRLARLDGLRHDARVALTDADLAAARRVTDALVRLYAGREDTRWGRDRLDDLRRDQLDAAGLLGLAEREVLVPLDAVARGHIEAAARQVATVTALVPLPLADVVAALAANVRMIRRIAEVYAGRSGFFGSWRLITAVLSHLVATGAIAVGDDLLEPVLGGTIVGKLSRRFGEGLVNGALTARVGVAAMDVCRPLPFGAGLRPGVRAIIKGSLSGLFGPKQS